MRSMHSLNLNTLLQTINCTIKLKVKQNNVINHCKTINVRSYLLLYLNKALRINALSKYFLYYAVIDILRLPFNTCLFKKNININIYALRVQFIDR